MLPIIHAAAVPMRWPAPAVAACFIALPLTDCLSQLFRAAPAWRRSDVVIWLH
jgi:hypothetical protein